MRKKFEFLVPRHYDGKHIGYLHIHAIAYLNRFDNSFSSVDIDHVYWGRDTDVANYICQCHPAEWDELLQAAENNYKSEYET